MCREARQATADAPAIQGATDNKTFFSPVGELSELDSLGIICSARSYRLLPSKVIRKSKHRPVEKSVSDEIREWQREMLESVSKKEDGSEAVCYIPPTASPTEDTKLCNADRYKKSDIDCGIISHITKYQKPLILNPSSLCRTIRC